MVLGRPRLFKEFLRTVLSGWNISTRLSIPDKDDGGTTPISPVVIRTDRSDVSAVAGEGRISRTFPVNDGTTKEPGHRLLFRDCPRRSRYYLVDFSYVLLSSTNLSDRDIENVSGGQIIERWSSIIWNSLLEILNFTPELRECF